MIKTHLERHWDVDKVCHNPHKGWYLHYYDNRLDRYGSRLADGDFLEDLPGLNHIYLRLAWSYLEPEEGRYNWEVIDRVIEPWTQHGYGVAFRITCKETSSDQCFATPKWVMDAGAQGTFWPAHDGGKSWEPDYGDPVFLDKLETFHRVFAERYGQQPWLEYVDIGSYGEWGEGHTARSGRRDWPAAVIKQHIDIYCRHYQDAFIMINDDMIGGRKVEDGSREDILRYALSKGLALRDDGICVKYYSDTFGLSTLRSPEMFTLFWRTRPIDIELEHYQTTLDRDTYKEGVPLVAAVEESHGTYVGFHGYPRQWLAENLELARHLANRAGYWYFPKSIDLPESARPGAQISVKLVWENHGLAPAYHHYPLTIKLANEQTHHVQEIASADNRSWMPCEIIGDTYTIDLPDTLLPGPYRVGIALYDERDTGKRPIELGLSDELKDREGFYTLAELQVVGT